MEYTFIAISRGELSTEVSRSLFDDNGWFTGAGFKVLQFFQTHLWDIQNLSLWYSTGKDKVTLSQLSHTHPNGYLSHIGHGSFVYITVNPAVLAHSCAFPWLRMSLYMVCVWLLWTVTSDLAVCEDKWALKLLVLQANFQWSSSIIVKAQRPQLRRSKCHLLLLSIRT